MAAYVIADVEVSDVEGYEEYRTGVEAILQPYGGRFLIRGGPVETLEGDWTPQRYVTIEFPSMEQAKRWYDSPEYQAILPIRKRCARSRVLLVDGVAR